MKKKVWIICGVILGILVASVGGAAFMIDSVINSTLDEMVTTDQLAPIDADVAPEVIELEKESNVINVALFGVDNRDDSYGLENSRSDAMKILSLDLTHNKAMITSVQRDMLIYVPGEVQDFDKLNHAYWYGGAQLALQTFNYNFDLDLTRYITVNFSAVERMINYVGGVTVDGTTLSTGAQALTYMRNRAVDSDYGRMDRQTQVILAVFEKVKTLSFNDQLSLLNSCLQDVETNLTKDEIIDLGLKALKIDLRNIGQFQIPSGAYNDTRSVSYKGFSPLYVIRSYEGLVSDIHRNIYGNESYQASQRVLETQAAIYEKFGRFE